MNTRVKFSAALFSIGLMLAFIPRNADQALTLNPKDLLTQILDESNSFTPDQVARFVVNEDSTLQLIDLRSTEEYNAFNIPGSVNIPYDKFLDTDQGYLSDKGNVKTVFYSNGDLESGYALTLTRGMKHKNTFAMKGGLNEWYKTVMNTSFSGERISARENALFETRTKARNHFTTYNSLPDSLKSSMLKLKSLEKKKLDGGCE